MPESPEGVIQCPCRFGAFDAPKKYFEYRRVIASGSGVTPAVGMWLRDQFVIPEDRDVMLTRVLVSRNKTALEILQRCELIIVKGVGGYAPSLSASLRALYEDPHLVSRPIFERGYAVTVKLETDPDTLGEVNWPISVQLIGLQG